MGYILLLLIILWPCLLTTRCLQFLITRLLNITLKHSGVAKQKDPTLAQIILMKCITVHTYLQGCHPELLTTPALSDLGQIIDKTLKNVGGIQVTVVVYIYVNNTLSIWEKGKTN